MSKATPGPWRVGYSDGSGASGPYTITAVATDEEVVNSAEGDNADMRSWSYGIDNPHDAALIAAAPDLLAVLQRYVNAYPAFRIKPVGAPGSTARIEQERLMALEDAARDAIAKAEGIR